MDSAVIRTGGKQYQVRENEELVIEKLPQEESEKVIFEQILLVKKGEEIFIGKPQVKQARVTAKVISQFKDKKVRVATYKAKSRYRKVKGHRQPKTLVRIERIEIK